MISISTTAISPSTTTISPSTPISSTTISTITISTITTSAITTSISTSIISPSKIFSPSKIIKSSIICRIKVNKICKSLNNIFEILINIQDLRNFSFDISSVKNQNKIFITLIITLFLCRLLQNEAILFIDLQFIMIV